MKRRNGKGIHLYFDDWREKRGTERVLIGIISDVHLDRFFPEYSLKSLKYQLGCFRQRVKDRGSYARGILVVLGDYIDFLTLGETSPYEVSCVQEINGDIREMQLEGIEIIFGRGNHDRNLFANQAWRTWIGHVIPGAVFADYVHIVDDWAQVVMFHGHLWDIFNCEIENKRGHLVTPLGDLIVRHLVTEMQQVTDIGGRKVDCSDINRVHPFHNIPLYLATVDPSRKLLRMWLLKFECLMHSFAYRNWVKHALPLGRRIMGNLLPHFYEVYRGLSSDEDDVLRVASQLDKKSSGYMFDRQREFLTGELEIENRYTDWDEELPEVRIVINGHSHRSGIDELENGGCSISTGAWVKRVLVHAETDQGIPVLRPQYRLTWTELECDLEKKTITPKQDSHQAVQVI